MKKPIYLLLLVLIVLALASPAFAQNEPTDDEVNAIAKGLYCPVCENIPLDVCGTQACAQWRDLIREKLNQGWSEAQIKDYFVAQYGDRVLATPPARGLNWLVYIIPPLAILAGIYVLYRAFQSWKQPPQAAANVGNQTPQPAPPSAPQPPVDDYALRLEEELKKR